MKKLLISVFLISQLTLMQKCFAQISKISFKFIEEKENIDIVKFDMNKILDEPVKENLISMMIHSGDEKIQHVKISGTTVRMKVEKNISAEYFRSFLLKMNTDFNINSVNAVDEKIYNEIKHNNK